MKTTILILLVGILALNVVSARVNDNYGHFLKGEQVALDTDLLKVYQDFLSEYKGKSFNVNTDMERFMIFKDNVRRIIAHNSNPDSTWKMGVNHLSDMTREEKFAQYHLMEKQECSATASPRNFYNEPTPDEFNWVDKNMVSPVKDQKSCGSCWTFSTTGAMEAHMKISHGEEVLLSEQELVDCPDPDKYDTHGCNGGLPSYAFDFIHDFGIEHENDYPYQAHDAECRFNKERPRVTTDGAFIIEEGNEDQLKEELFQKGPVSVAFEVVEDFMDYTSGVYSSTECKNGPMDVNHAVLAVGYGTENGVDYWLVKNSWSEHWGDKGYFKIQRGVNMCGIAVCNSYPLNVRTS
jgi:cathepsin H